MEGYYVVVKDANDETSSSLKQLLAKSLMVNLKNTRSFNAFTENQFKRDVQSATGTIRNRTDENKEKRRKYNSNPLVKERLREYNQRPEVKERKRKNRELKQKILKNTPKEVIVQILKEDEQLQMNREKNS